MESYDRPLDSFETKSLTDGNGRLEAIIEMALSDIIDSEGLDEFDKFVNQFFPDVILTDMRYEVVGSVPPQKGDFECVKGAILVKVVAFTE